ncbi:MAG: DivIVA domain-containing protein [Mycoplasmataceae bacterium]|nr:DivIVA domain-containing protein [Mycoplasmataceae bacterium]
MKTENIIEFQKKLLNKKFIKAYKSGYDAEEVDEFFDYVSEFIGSFKDDYANWEKKAAELVASNKKILEENNRLVEENKKLLNTIEIYKQEGYEGIVNKITKKNNNN